MSEDRTTTLDVTPLAQPCGCPAQPEITRRSFLKAAGATGIVAGLASEGTFTRLAFGAPYVGDVLVVLSLRGGMDSLQAVVPAAAAQYDHYANWRPNIAVPHGQLLQLDADFGLHPAMAPLKPLYDAGSLGIVNAVGMAQPNRSHFSAMEEMERAAPGHSVRTGWLDRVLGLRDTGSPFQATQLGSNSAASAFLGPAPELAEHRRVRPLGCLGCERGGPMGQRPADGAPGRATRDRRTRTHRARRALDRVAAA